MESKKKLSIIIPTFNRKERLLLQLHSLYCQKEVYETEIIICDNKSSYNVEDAIRQEFSDIDISNLIYTCNIVNIGMGANLSSILLKGTADWIWTLSDDDMTMEGSIATILNDIKQFPTTDLFKYSIDIFEENRDITVNNLCELANYYLKHHNAPGEFVFISNCVYKRGCILKYFGNALTESYTLIGHMLPIINALDKCEATLRFRPQTIVHFLPASPNTGWGMFYGALGVSSVSCLQLQSSWSDINRLTQVAMSGFSHYWLVQKAVTMKDRKRAKFLYKQIYDRSYKYSGRVIDKIWYGAFLLFYILHIDPIFINDIRNIIKKK